MTAINSSFPITSTTKLDENETSPLCVIANKIAYATSKVISYLGQTALVGGGAIMALLLTVEIFGGPLAPIAIPVHLMIAGTAAFFVGEVGKELTKETVSKI
jgi:hypothetical protein